MLTQTTATITTTLTYDGLNRVISKSFSDGSPSVFYSYDANGDTGYRTGMTDGSGTTVWDYDPRGRLIKGDKTISGQAFTTLYTYDSADQLKSMTYPNGETVIITNLPQGGNKTIGSYLTGTQVDSNGRVSIRSFGNGTTTSLTYNDWLTEGGRLGTLQSGQSGSLLNLNFTYDSVGNITSITDNLNSSQVQTFTYDSMERLTTASTNSVGAGQYAPQTYTYNPATGNISSKSDVGAYTYSSTQPHAVTQAGSNSYAYDQNGNMTSRTVDGVGWTYTYNADGQLTQTRKNNQLVSEYGYDGDGKRVWAKDYESSGAQKETIYIGNYYEFVTEVLTPEPGAGGVCTGTYCTYLPMVIRSPLGISYYYADGQRIAMKDKNGVVSYLYGDQLGSVSVVADSSGNLVSRTLYEPWGEIRHTEGTSPTDYGYTGQMKEDDIYFYNARWPQVREAQRRGFDPQLGRFMQADTIVPLQVQGTQAFDRYAYVNNNPMGYVDPGGNFALTLGAAMLIGGLIAVAVNYGVQVYHNTQQGMEFKNALTTDISVGSIAVSMAIGAVASGAMFGVASALVPQAFTATGAVCVGACPQVANEMVESGTEMIQNATSVIRPVPQIRLNFLKGQFGEVLSGWSKYIAHIKSLTNTANFRIPDFLDPDLKILGEVKNVNYLGVTNQLRDFALYAQQQGYQFIIKTFAVKFSGTFERFVKEFGIIVEKLK